MTRLPQLGGFTEPHSANVLGKKRHDKIFAITADRHLSPKRYRAFPEGLQQRQPLTFLPLTYLLEPAAFTVLARPQRLKACWRNMAIARPMWPADIIRRWASTSVKWRTTAGRRPRPIGTLTQRHFRHAIVRPRRRMFRRTCANWQQAGGHVLPARALHSRDPRPSRYSPCHPKRWLAFSVACK